MIDGQRSFRVFQPDAGVTCRHDLEPAGSGGDLRQGSLQPRYGRTTVGPAALGPGRSAGTFPDTAMSFKVPRLRRKCSGAAPATPHPHARSARDAGDQSAAPPTGSSHAPGHNFSTGRFPATVNRPATLITSSISNCIALAVRACAQQESALAALAAWSSRGRLQG